MQADTRSQRPGIAEWKRLGTHGKRYIILHGDLSSCNLKYVDNILGPVAHFEDPSEEFPIAGLEVRENESEMADLQLENSQLRHFIKQYAAHMQPLKTALAFLIFFSAVLAIQLLTTIWLIAPVLAWAGIAISLGGILLFYLSGLDWRDWLNS